MAPVRWQAALDAALYLLFFIPALTIFLWVSTEYAVDSWIQGERSNLSPWLPPVYPLKTVLPVSAALLLLRSEEHNSELQSLMRISYAVFCSKNNIHTNQYNYQPEDYNKHIS